MRRRSTATEPNEHSVSVVSKTADTRPFEGDIVRILSAIKEVDAIFIETDANNVCHVYSVVMEHEHEVYRKVMRAESRIEKKLPDIRFDFRVRAHQGRAVTLTVPVSSHPAFLR
jgi:hypothetical protein